MQLSSLGNKDLEQVRSRSNRVRLTRIERQRTNLRQMVDWCFFLRMPQMLGTPSPLASAFRTMLLVRWLPYTPRWAKRFSESSCPMECPLHCLACMIRCRWTKSTFCSACAIPLLLEQRPAGIRTSCLRGRCSAGMCMSLRGRRRTLRLAGRSHRLTLAVPLLGR